MNSSLTEKKWLVKSENKILGPYNFDQVEDLLLKKQISIIDEIRDTQTRWLYLRENTEFKSVIGKIRQQLDNKTEATKTIQGSHSQTGTRPSDDYLQATRSNALHFTDVSMSEQEASIQNETIDPANPSRTRDWGTNLNEQNHSKYIFQNDPASQQQIQFFSKNLKVILLISFILSLSGIFSYYFYNKYNQQRLESELLIQVKKLKFLGLGQQAAVLYARLNPLSQKKFFIEVIDLYPYLESLGFQIKNLEDLETTANLSIDNKVSIYMSRFWIYMQMQNFELAQIQIIKAKALQPADLLINENEALLNLRTGKYLPAIDAFLKLYTKNINGRFLVGAIQAFQELDPADQAKYSANLEKLVDRHIAIRYDYKKELLLAQMAFSINKNNDVLFKLSWKQFLNTPTQMAALFKKPSLLAPLSYQWINLEQYITAVRKKLSPSENRLFQVHDYLESSQISAAVDYVEKNKNDFVDMPSSQQMKLLIYNALNKRNEILSLNRANQLDKKSELNQVIIGLSKVQIDPEADVKETLNSLIKNNLKFYADWITLTALIQKKSTAEINNFLKTNYSGESDFLLVEEARSLLE